MKTILFVAVIFVLGCSDTNTKNSSQPQEEPDWDRGVVEKVDYLKERGFLKDHPDPVYLVFIKCKHTRLVVEDWNAFRWSVVGDSVDILKHSVVEINDYLFSAKN